MPGWNKPSKFTVSRAWDSTEVESMYARFHPYKSGPGRGAIHYKATENGKTIAVFSFKPPAYGSAYKVCQTDPHSVVSLSRMCAVPKEERETKHISKIMRKLWDLLPEKYRIVVTYSDSSCNHTGYVYQCSGFTKEETVGSAFYVDSTGARCSINTSGKVNREAILAGYCCLTRWTLRIRDESGARI